MEQMLKSLVEAGLPEWLLHAQPVFRVIAILILVWIAILVANKGIRLFRQYMESRTDDVEVHKRMRTLGRVFRYIATVVLSLVGGMLVLDELGISIAPILATAGVAGLAVGFGAQSLIKDYFTGFFLLLEDQLRQGDVVAIADKGGLVEVITLRYVRLRDYDGNVHFVPNGTITTVTNRSRGFAYAVVDAGIAYRENVDEAIEVMRSVGSEMRNDPVFGPKILEDLEVAGVDQWADSAVILRCRFKVKPLEQWGIRREFLRRLKHAFDHQGIEIPFPHLTVYAGQAKDGTAPPLPVVHTSVQAAG